MALERSLPLAERLRPTRLDEVIGNAAARTQLRAWADRWTSGTPPAQRAALISGPPGVGKTTAALAIAAEHGWSVVEMNASDARNERAIEQVAGRASISHTLLEAPGGRGPRRALILLDEADSLSGRATETARPPPAVTTLRDFLRGRYGAVSALNDAWGLKPDVKPAAFESWDGVPRSPGNFAWARLPPARRDIDEWRSAGRPRDNSDRGGLGAIARLVRATRQPLVLTVNDDRVLTRYSAVFRTSVARIRFGPVRDREMAEQLEGIAHRESLDLAPGAIEAIVRRAHGDVRAALNDLEAVSPIPRGPLQLSLLGSRDSNADFETVTEEVLSSARFYRMVEIRDRLDAPPDDLLPWIEENFPHFAPDATHRAAAADRLSAAERSLARARRFRVWGLWSYATELLTGGVGLALRDAPVPVTGRAYFPRFLGEMGRSRTVRATRDAVAGKAGARFHLSRRKSRDVFLPFLEEVVGAFRDPRSRRLLADVLPRLVRELELTPEEVAFLAHSEPDSSLVAELMATPSERADRGVGSRGGDTEADVETDPTRGNDPSDSSERRRVQRQLSDFGAR